MREGRTGVRLKRHKNEENTVYTVQITSGQIMTMRSLYLRVEQTWVHHGVAELLRETGRVERVPFWECYYCAHGSYESAQAIAHLPDCIVTIADREFAALNAQFIAVLAVKEE